MTVATLLHGAGNDELPYLLRVRLLFNKGVLGLQVMLA